MIALNVRGVFLSMKYQLRHMVAQGSGDAALTSGSSAAGGRHVRGPGSGQLLGYDDPVVQVLADAPL
jgi:hypothetical protein